MYQSDFAKTWTRDIFSAKKATAIVAVFKSGREVTYTMNVFNLLKTDPGIDCIYNSETGEIIYNN